MVFELPVKLFGSRSKLCSRFGTKSRSCCVKIGTFCLGFFFLPFCHKLFAVHSHGVRDGVIVNDNLMCTSSTVLRIVVPADSSESDQA